MKLLETNEATIQFGGLTAVNKLSIEAHEGEIVSIIGPNGAGKTTAFNMITGEYVPTFGTIAFRGKEIQGTRPDKITKLGIARTFQNIHLFQNLSVLDNVLSGCHLRLKSDLFSSVLALPGARKEEAEMRKFSQELLERTGLVAYTDEVATNLPYGLQRRLEIARALATKPTLLLLDEPAAGMNPKESEDLTAFIRQIRDEFKLTILLIEHHMQLIMDISDRIYVLEYGNTIAHGKPEEIVNDPVVVRAYLGEED
jgi:branched-chain amino acid transport system ATP-binding protein